MRTCKIPVACTNGIEANLPIATAFQKQSAILIEHTHSDHIIIVEGTLIRFVILIKSHKQYHIRVNDFLCTSLQIIQSIRRSIRPCRNLQGVGRSAIIRKRHIQGLACKVAQTRRTGRKPQRLSLVEFHTLAKCQLAIFIQILKIFKMSIRIKGI